MGMAASQGRLLFMTARISNNEFEQQCVAYSKQRLADDSQEANDRYLDALQSTQYQILTGYNGDKATYEPVSYNQLTGLNSVAARKQYIVSDNKGQIVVSDKIARAYDENYMNSGSGGSHTNADFNTFLKNIDSSLTQVAEPEVTEEDVHNAWDKYFVSINKGDPNGLYSSDSSYHILGFSYHNGIAGTTGSEVPYVTYNTKVLNLEKTGDAGNKIYLNEDSNGNLYYNNIKINVESFINNEGELQYRAYYNYSDFLRNIEGGINLMQDSDKVYIKNVFVSYDETNNKYIYADESGNVYGSEYYDSEGNMYVDANMGENYLTTPNLATAVTSGDYSGRVDVTDVGSRPASSIEEANYTIFYDGATQEQRNLYDYAMAVSEKYAKGSALNYDADKVEYYRNIYQQMTTKGFTTYDKMINDKYINTMGYKSSDGSTKSIDNEALAFNNDNWLVTLLKNGKLAISFYDINDAKFIETTLDEDESIVEKENKSKMAIAEQVYKTHMDRIESEDKRFDMQLTKLESEHTALTTEYESVAKVISKNVEKSFNVFNA